MIYKDSELDEIDVYVGWELLLEKDEISAAEAGFMAGYEGEIDELVEEDNREEIIA